MAGSQPTAGERIYDARRRRGWLHVDMLEAILGHPQLGPRYRCSEKTLDNVEKGRVKTPSVRTQFAISIVLELDFDLLWPAKSHARSGRS